MFRERISVISPVSTVYADSLIRPDNEPDYTLTLLGIGCLRRKLPEYKGISGKYGTVTLNYIKDNINYEDNGVAFYYLITKEHMNAETREFLADKGFIHREPVEKLLKMKFSTLESAEVMYSTKKNIALVVVPYDRLDLYHFVLSFLPLYYPNIYTKPLTKEDPEVAPLSALCKNSPDEFRRTYPALVEEYRREFMHIELEGLMKRFHEMEIQRYADRDRNLRSEAQSMFDRYVAKMEEVREAAMLLAGARAFHGENEKEKELINYLETAKEVRDIRISGSEITFTVATRLKQFDSDSWAVFARKGGIFDGNYRADLKETPFAHIENRKIFLNSIFSDDPKFEIKLVGNYSFDVYHQYVNSNRGYNYEALNPDYKNYIPNPHLKLFSCLGNYETRIVNRIREDDLITAIELCIASAGSINLDETEQTFRPFLGWLLTNENKVLVRYDGVEMTPQEALIWLLDEQKGKDK